MSYRQDLMEQKDPEYWRQMAIQGYAGVFCDKSTHKSDIDTVLQGAMFCLEMAKYLKTEQAERK